MSDQKEIENIQAQLKKWREEYYNLSPSVPDDKYDALKDRLRELDPVNEEVLAVGVETSKTSTFEKVEHIIPMGSLNKVNSEKEFRDFVVKLIEDGAREFLISHKLDGSSLELVYQNGKLIRGITRGDGKIGEDITVNIVQIPSIPKVLSMEVPGEIIVRGEVIMHKDTFQKVYAKDYANPRNTAAGKLRDKKNAGVDCKNLEFYAFELEMNTQPMLESQKFKALSIFGFQVPWHQSGSLDDIVKAFENQKEIRSHLPYEIDGEVISANEIAVQERLGSHNMRPRFKIAWKFDAEMGVTQVIDVKWQVGPTGRITPVAQTNPVKIGGVTITSISLHNMKMFKLLKLSPGDSVLVKRANDVIPYLEENLTRGISAS